MIITSSALLGFSFFLAVVCMNLFPSQEDKEPVSAWIGPSVIFTICIIILSWVGKFFIFPGLGSLSSLVILLLVWQIYQTESLIETVVLALLGGIIFKILLFLFFFL